MMLLLAAHQAAVCTKSVGNDLFGVGRKFDVACFVKAGGRLAQPDAALLVQIVIFKAVKAVVDDDVLWIACRTTLRFSSTSRCCRLFRVRFFIWTRTPFITTSIRAVMGALLMI